jgi:putative phage-type endonuclease
MIEKIILDDRDAWLAARKHSIGGSDAACIIGLNPWKSNRQLWEEKKGIRAPEDISDKPVVKYGTLAEAPLRELFALDYPQLVTEYDPNNVWRNSDYPFAHYSADGTIYEPGGRMGLLEIKTVHMANSIQREKWRDRIPDNYYCQLLWGMAVTGAEFAILKALQIYENETEKWSISKHYRIERAAHEGEIAELMEAGRKFAESLLGDTPPALILNF